MPGTLKTYKARGIVLNSLKYGDSAMVVHLLTDALGRQSYMVQGVRSNRGRGSKLALFQPMFALEFEGLTSSRQQMHRFRASAITAYFCLPLSVAILVIRVKIIDLPTTMTDFPVGQEWVLEMVNNILIEVLGTIAEQERTTIRQRQREGIESARSKGKHLGRPPLQRPENWEAVYASWQRGELTARKAMELTGLKRSSFYKLVKKMEQ